MSRSLTRDTIGWSGLDEIGLALRASAQSCANVGEHLLSDGLGFSRELALHEVSSENLSEIGRHGIDT